MKPFTSPEQMLDAHELMLGLAGEAPQALSRQGLQESSIAWPLSEKAAVTADMVWRLRLTHLRHGPRVFAAMHNTGLIQ